MINATNNATRIIAELRVIKWGVWTLVLVAIVACTKWLTWW